MAFGMCLVDRTCQGSMSQAVWGSLVGVLQRHLSEYQTLAGQEQVNSTTAAHLSPLGTQECIGIALDENSGSASPIPIDIITARLGLQYLCWEASRPHQRRPPYDVHIAISTSLEKARPSRHIAIIMTEDGCCALLTQGVIMRQACEGLVKLLPQRQSSHRNTSPPPPH
jgi:hypothetical protein